jgi:hypothetical protein
MVMVSTILSSLGIVSVIGVGIWVGTIQTKISTIEKVSVKLDRVAEDVAFIKGTLSKAV